jgi:hypothetical protein
MSAAPGLSWPAEEGPLFEDHGWQGPEGDDRAPLDAALKLTLSIVVVMLVLTMTALALCRGPLADLVTLPERIVAGLGS